MRSEMLAGETGPHCLCGLCALASADYRRIGSILLRLIRPFLAAVAISQFASPCLAFGNLGNSGSYLAARHASVESDYGVAAEYYLRALTSDPSSAILLENAISAEINLGDVPASFPMAQRLLDLDPKYQVAALAILAEQANQGAYADILQGFADGRSIGGLLDGLAKAWAQLGAGQVTEALASFDAVSAETGLKYFGLYHKALALASVGDFEGADGILSGRANGPLQMSRRGVIAHAEVLSELDRNADAIELIDKVIGPNPVPEFDAMRAALAAGETLTFDVAPDPKSGLAEVFYSVAEAIQTDSAPGFSLLYSRIAEYLNPNHVDAILLSASLLEALQQYDLVNAAYDRVPADSPASVTAELGRAGALLTAKKNDEAIAVLTTMADSHPDLLAVQVTLADTLRQLDRHAEASMVYDRALALVGEPVEQRYWVLLFSRGITRERTDRWPEAEADFRAALMLNPGQPQVLNYLGYSLVEKNESLDEALGMIQQAVQARPDDAYITDSLGWALYRMGRYPEAVVQMERANELMATDPVVTDHLGDVYWASGRHLEAQFQWRRALSFKPEDKDAVRIRRKLDVGLDAVLIEEGAKPLAVSKDG